MATTYARRLAKLAEDEFNNYHGYHETTSRMSNRIRTYWSGIGKPFPGTGTAWSAVFVSYFVKMAGASAAEFLFSSRHSEFVHQAIKNSVATAGVFRGFAPASYAPKIGDIIQNNRDGNTFDFAYATANNGYFSHSAIVVEEGNDGNGRYVRTIGGNEDDSVGDRIVRLKSNGLIKPPSPGSSYFISVIQTLK